MIVIHFTIFIAAIFFTVLIAAIFLTVLFTAVPILIFGPAIHGEGNGVWGESCGSSNVIVPLVLARGARGCFVSILQHVLEGVVLRCKSSETLLHYTQTVFTVTALEASCRNFLLPVLFLFVVLDPLKFLSGTDCVFDGLFVLVELLVQELLVVLWKSPYKSREIVYPESLKVVANLFVEFIDKLDDVPLIDVEGGDLVPFVCLQVCPPFLSDRGVIKGVL